MARIQLSTLQLSLSLGWELGPCFPPPRAPAPWDQDRWAHAPHSVRTVRLKGETSEQASKTAFSRDYLINPSLYNRNIDFHRFPEYFREYIYWQVNLRSREELNKEKGLNFLSDFPFTTFSTFLEWNFWFLTLKIKYHCLALLKTVFQFSLVTQSCLTLCDPMDRSMPGLPVHHQLPDLAQEW